MANATGFPTCGQQRLRQEVYRFLHQVPDFAAQGPAQQERMARNFFATLSSLPLVQSDPLLARRHDAGISSLYVQWLTYHQDYTQHLSQTTSSLPIERFAFLHDGLVTAQPRYQGGTNPFLTLTYLLQLARHQAPICEEVTFYPYQQFLTAGKRSRHCLLAYALWGEQTIAVQRLSICSSRLEVPDLPFGKTLLEIQDTLTVMAPKVQFRFRDWNATERRAVQLFGQYPRSDRQAILTSFITDIARHPLKWFDMAMLLTHIEEIGCYDPLDALKQWWTSMLYRFRF